MADPPRVTIGGPVAVAAPAKPPAPKPAPPPAAAPPAGGNGNIIHLQGNKGLWTLEEVEQLVRELGFDPRRFTPER